ncbi:MAG: hypothetical protein FWC70_12075 [Defluviitaleaceae bacterium]|nr:hypothetical protein [Defluviitaleaceae bacterium]
MANKRKKFLALLLAFVLTLTMVTPGFATDGGSNATDATGDRYATVCVYCRAGCPSDAPPCAYCPDDATPCAYCIIDALRCSGRRR